MDINQTKFNRFKDAPWLPKVDTHVMIGGAGGIGSWTSLLIARAGFIPIVYDFDMLEEHNLGGQLFPRGSIGMTKIAALSAVVRAYADTNIIGMIEKMEAKTPIHKYMICAFDNMEARQLCYDKWLASYGEDNTAIFIDGRLNAEHMQIFCVRGGTKSEDELKFQYASYLFADGDIPEVACTMKQTSHAAAMIAAHITGFFTNHFTNVVEEDDSREVPFYWEYNIPMNYTNDNP